MGKFACTRWKLIRSINCLQDVLFLFATWRSLTMAFGSLLPASRSLAADLCAQLTVRSEIEVKIVDIRDMTNVMYLREHPKPAKHVTFHPSDSCIAVSCTDGIIYIYDLNTGTPILERKLDGVIRSLESDDEISSEAAWHPDGRAFACPMATRDIQVISRSDGENQRAFGDGHTGDVTTLAWSPNGALLLSAGSDGKILLWETKTQKVLARYFSSVDSGLGTDQCKDTIIPKSLILPGIHLKISSHLSLRKGNCSFTRILFPPIVCNFLKILFSQLRISMTHFQKYPVTPVNFKSSEIKIMIMLETEGEALRTLLMTSLVLI